MPQPFNLSDEEYSVVMAAAAPIAAAERGDFLNALAAELERRPVVGAGVVHRLAADLQRRYVVEARQEAAARDVPRHFRPRASAQT